MEKENIAVGLDIGTTKIVAMIGKKNENGKLEILGVGKSKSLGVARGVVNNITQTIQSIQRAVIEAEANSGYKINDVVVGIAASGTTPYVIGGLEMCNQNNISTGSISCNAESPLSKTAKFPIDVVVGPEFVTGSSRMKAGTAQKLVLNMISTATMIQLGKVKGNKMVDMQLSNNKLVDRGVKMIMGEMSSIIIEGSRASNEKIKSTGFTFKYPDLNAALEDLINK